MSFFGPLFVWAIIAAVMVVSVVLAVKVSIFFLFGALAVFGLLFIKYGCLSH